MLSAHNFGPGFFSNIDVFECVLCPYRFTAFVIHMLGSLDSLTNFMWSIVPILNHFDKFFLE